MGQNVWVKSGKVVNLLAGDGRTSAGYGDFLYKDSPNTTFQVIVSGSGAVAAEVDIEVSNDGVNALETAAGTVTLTGTDVSTDGFTTNNASWKYVRAHVVSVTGTGATVQVYMGC